MELAFRLKLFLELILKILKAFVLVCNFSVYNSFKMNVYAVQICKETLERVNIGLMTITKEKTVNLFKEQTNLLVCLKSL